MTKPCLYLNLNTPQPQVYAPGTQRASAYNTIVATITKTDTVSFTHQALNILADSAGASWVAKPVLASQRHKAFIEVVAQELLRLILGSQQPRTWPCMDDQYQSSRLFVLSEYINNLTPLSTCTNFAEHFARGGIRGLGGALLASLFLDEIDLNLNNLAIDPYGRIVKLDSEWCYAHELSGQEILTEELDALPYILPQHRKLTNWLDIYLRGEPATNPSQINVDGIYHSAQFRQEINETILKIICLSSYVLEKLVTHYVGNSHQALTGDQEIAAYLKRKLLSKQQELASAAMMNASFCHFILATDVNTIRQFTASIFQFEMANKELVSTDAHITQQISDHMYNLYMHYRSQAAAYLSNVSATISQSQCTLWSQSAATTVTEEAIYSRPLAGSSLI